MQTDTLQRTELTNVEQDVKQSVTQDPQPAPPLPSASIAATAPGQLRVIKRNGTVVSYDDSKIAVAMTKAFLAVEGGTAAASSRVREQVRSLVDQMSATFERRFPSGGTLHIEDIQDQVELALMRSGEHKVARDYVLYRDSRARARAERKPVAKPTQTNLIDHARRRHPRTARRRASAHRRERSLRRPQRRRRRADHRRSTEQHVRRHLREGRRHVGADHRAHAGRGRAELHVRHRAHPARRSARRSARVPRRSGARRNRRRLPRHAIADARGLSGGAEGVHRSRRRARTRRRPTCASSTSTRSARR